MAENRVGTVTHWFGRIHVATVRVEQPLRLGDRLLVRSRDREMRLRVTSMEIDHSPVAAAAPGQEVGIQVPARVRAREGDVVVRDERGGWLRRLLGR